jgi:hypothetical protein
VLSTTVFKFPRASNLIPARNFSETPSRPSRSSTGNYHALRYCPSHQTVRLPSLRARPKIITPQAFVQKNGGVMSKNWIMLTGLLFLGSVGASQAHPLDTPDVVYIDGLPCNSACQSYMAWTRRKTSPVTEQSAPLESTPAESPTVHYAPEKPVLRSAQPPAQHSKAARREGAKPAAPRVAKRTAPLPAVGLAKPQPADVAVNSKPAPTEVSKPAPADVAAPPSADSAAPPSPTRTVQEQVAAATALAENLTAASAAPAPQREAADAEASAQSGAAEPGDTASKVAAATDSTDNRVALLIARPEIRSVSDLAGKDVAIENQQSASSASIQAAIASAGAAEVRLDEKSVSAVDRLVGGNVSAAVLTLVSPQAAEWFPDVPGYKIFRIPLSPRSVRARL